MKKVFLIFSILIVAIGLIAASATQTTVKEKNTIIVPNYTGSSSPWVSALYTKDDAHSVTDTNYIMVSDKGGAPITQAYMHYVRFAGATNATGTSGTVAFDVRPGWMLNGTFYYTGAKSVAAALDCTKAGTLPLTPFRTLLVSANSVLTDTLGALIYNDSLSGNVWHSKVAGYYGKSPFNCIRVIATTATDTSSYKYWFSFLPGNMNAPITPTFPANKNP